MLLVVIDLTAALAPEAAVARLAGLGFKRSERRLKRLARDGSIAEAALGGALRVMRVEVCASEGAALLLRRRWTTIADFPWASRMDTEALVVQHTTLVTHLVRVVCESEPGGGGCVRVEWEFAAAAAAQGDGAERVDWVLDRLGAPAAAPAARTLACLLRRHKRAEQEGAHGDGEAAAGGGGGGGGGASAVPGAGGQVRAGGGRADGAPQGADAAPAR